jgi:hypothetical protein
MHLIILFKVNSLQLVLEVLGYDLFCYEWEDNKGSPASRPDTQDVVRFAD